MPRSSATIWSVMTLLAALATAGPAAAEDAGDAMSRGLELLRAFEYDAAIEQFQSVFDSEASSPAERIAALERIGATYFNTNRRDQARATFERLLDCDPGHQLTDRAFPPPVQQFYAEIRAAHQPAAATVDAEARETSPESGRLRLRATLGQGGQCAAAAVARVRGAGGGSFEEVPLELQGGELMAELDAPPPGQTLEYALEVRAPSGEVIARAGSTDAPLAYVTEVPVEEPPQPPADAHRRRWYRSWWFWTIVGVAVAGAGTATAVVLTLPEDVTGSLGSGRLQ